MNNIREDDQKAASYFLTAIEKDNNYAEPRNNLGQLYQRYKLFDQAIYYYNEALNISAHDYSEARNNLTNAESQLKELLSSEDYPRGPTGDTDWFWLNWDDDDASSTLKRSVVRIVPRQGGGAGTGWVVHRENNSLWIVTNRHVIGEVGEIDVQFFSNRPPKRDYLKLPATPVQISPDIDLALLKVDGAPPNIAPLTIARESLSSFSAVRIVGHPEISDEWTIVDGSASRNNSQTDPYSFVDGNHLQIDATVGTGNSGGPVINDKNQVVGVMHAATNGVIKVGSNGVVEVNDIAATGGFGGAYSVSALRNVLDSWDIHIP
ncbi:MAG: trypsin-like peptidase domain-containing protein [Cyanobacteria bacterium J06649_4]